MKFFTRSSDPPDNFLIFIGVGSFKKIAKPTSHPLISFFPEFQGNYSWIPESLKVDMQVVFQWKRSWDDWLSARRP